MGYAHLVAQRALETSQQLELDFHVNPSPPPTVIQSVQVVCQHNLSLARHELADPADTVSMRRRR
jgi:hypothetical protein